MKIKKTAVKSHFAIIYVQSPINLLQFELKLSPRLFIVVFLLFMFKIIKNTFLSVVQFLQNNFCLKRRATIMEDNKDLDFDQVQNDQSDKPCQCKESLPKEDGYKEKFLSLMADFQNFKKRSSAQETLWSTFAKEQMMLEFLPINDEFDRVLANKPANPTPEAAIWLTAVEALSKLFQSILNKHGVTEVPCDGIFNPELHEVISEVSSNEDIPKGQIVAIFKKGYFYNQKMIRNAQVVVAKGLES